MVEPGSLDTIEKIANWIYEHDGRIDAWWEGQREHNARSTATRIECQTQMREELATINQKIDAMNRTIYKAVGFATAIGCAVGVAVTLAVAFIER